MLMTNTEPVVTQRPAQPYVSIKGSVPMTAINTIADRLPDVFGWLAARGIAPAGAPFFKYNVIDMAHELEIEVGVPVAEPVAAEEPVLAGVLPAGAYATAVHIGHPKELYDATTALLAWAEGQGLRFDVVDTEAGERWGCRLEIYHTDPAEEPDMDKWTTELAFRLA
jgi:effector-binding domain-containing protein